MTRRFIVLDLQFFAEDDDDILLVDLQETEDEPLEPSGKPGDSEDDGEEESNLTGDGEDDGSPDGDSEDQDADPDESEDDGESGEGGAGTRDKKEAAIVRAKREAKEAKRKLAELESLLQAQNQAQEENTKKQELIRNGFSEEDAERIAKAEIENKRLKTELSDLRFKELEKTYPGIRNYKTQILELVEQFPVMTEAEIYLAKFARKSEFDRRTQTEQEMIYRQKNATDKAMAKGVSREADPIKLSDMHEKAFLILQKKDPTWTRKKFRELMDE